MIKYISVVWCLLCLLTSCKTIYLGQDSQTATTQQMALGSIGLEKDFILQTEYNNAAIPTYKTPLKVAVTVEPFNKQSYKQFKKAKALQAANFSIKYIDSIKQKPKYVKFKIADKVAVISALNDTNNNAVKSYLKNNNQTNILMSMSMALNQTDLEAVINADAVYLIEKSQKNYVLQLQQDSTKTKTLTFNQGVIFAYKGANCCWKENQRHQIDIVDLVTNFNSCPNKTYRSAQRAEKKINALSY